MSGENLNALPRGYRLDEYELVKVLGAGGFGITYLGYDHNLDKQVAIKEYLPRELAMRMNGSTVAPHSSGDQSDFEWGLERFLEEARVLAKFDHPNIIKVFRFFRNHGTGYIVMDYAEGESLSAYLSRQGTLSEPQLRGILLPVLSGLHFIHESDVLHRDIKPGNIMIRKDGTPVLIDFGAARQAMTTKSRSVTSIVTPGYAPIEQYSTKGNQGPWTDIYAMGAVAYRCLVGQTPEDATDRILNDTMKPASEAAKGRAEPDFLAAIDNALGIREADRPQSVGEWIEMFGEIPDNVYSLGGHSSQRRKLEPFELEGKKSGGGNKGPLYAAIGAVAALAIAAAGYYAVGGFNTNNGGGTNGGAITRGEVALDSAAITQMQKQLAQLGYRVSPSGTLDARTKAELARFQQDHDAEETGQPDQATLALLMTTVNAADQAAWDAARTTQTVDAFAAYRDEWPEGKFNKFAEQEITRLKDEEARMSDAAKRAAMLARDDEAFGKAQGVHTLDSYRAYLKAFPTGRHADQARQAFDRLNEVAKAANAEKKAQEDQVLRKEAQGLLAQMGYDIDRRDGTSSAKTNEAIRKFREEVGLPVSNKVDLILLGNLRQVAEDRMWGKTKNGRNASAYQAYLDRYPDGRYVGEAKEGLANAKKFEAMADAERALVRSIQTELARLGYAVGTPDGEQGRATTQAIKSFEEEFGLPVKGLATDTLLAALKDAAARPVKAIQSGSIIKDCEFCPSLIVVPAGSITRSTKAIGKDETTHTAMISKPIAVGVSEVTFDQWQACVDAYVCQVKGDDAFGGGTHPVVGISFNDAQNYVGFLSGKTGKRYRLLSEAEWQYVASANAVSTFGFGDDPQEVCAYGNVAGSESGFDWGADGCADNHGQETAPIMSYKPNDFGLYDVHGNAAEWVADCWHDDYEGAPNDGSAWTDGGDCNWRILRGGSWRNAVEYTSLERRTKLFGIVRANTNGVRVVRELAPGEGQ